MGRRLLHPGLGLYAGCSLGRPIWAYGETLARTNCHTYRVRVKRDAASE
jgi:hypothetical protein